ncbi:MAG: type II toxin-antitoxin system YafQ family toxin [Candidatus Bacteroides intestinipullorum]|uniref:Type II toxin-antitoxin system YafQ family toxin n=1 Tax=Candidatus Bacteroides intestinipullorum TaxID=2838471 RepID=A0A9E2KG74_9BACE|nr:type II toxin-antitoxin system YafQ family toxin [Candidatus Bacteroides intestinipullorum]
MKTLKMSSRFKKDLKRIQNSPKRIENVETVLRLLRDTGTVPMQYKPHMLTGNYSGCMECHIENDYLLIWMDEAEQVIKLLRLGSHSELF